ncbi:hypothetical protein D3C76_950190 [compost metagenome]
MFLPTSSASKLCPPLPGLANTAMPRTSSVENTRNNVSSRSIEAKTVSPGSRVWSESLLPSGISLLTAMLYGAASALTMANTL